MGARAGEMQMAVGTGFVPWPRQVSSKPLADTLHVLGPAGQQHCCSARHGPAACPAAHTAGFAAVGYCCSSTKHSPRLHQCFCLCMPETPARLPHLMSSWQTTPSPLADHNWLCFSSRPKAPMHSSETASRVPTPPGTDTVLKHLLSRCSG